MVSPASADFFIKTVNAKHAKLNAALDDLFRALSMQSDSEKEDKIVTLRKSADDLNEMIHEDEQPQWLRQVRNALTKERRFMSFYDLLQNLMAVHRDIKTYQWVITDESLSEIDFDAIYVKYKNASKLPQLFDETIVLLHEIANSKEIDSRKQIAALEKLISMIEKNKGGSYFSVEGAWTFLFNFAKNYLFEELKEVPGLGSLVSALEKTIADLDAEISSIKSNVAEEIKSAVVNEGAQFLYDRSGWALNASSSRLLSASA